MTTARSRFFVSAAVSVAVAVAGTGLRKVNCSANAGRIDDGDADGNGTVNDDGERS